MTIVDFNLYKLGLINKISSALSMQEIHEAFNTSNAAVEAQMPCAWTADELKECLKQSDDDFKNGRYMSGADAITYFNNKTYGSKMVR